MCDDWAKCEHCKFFDPVKSYCNRMLRTVTIGCPYGEDILRMWVRIDYSPCGHDYQCPACGWNNDMPAHFCPNCGVKFKGTVPLKLCLSSLYGKMVRGEK